MIQVESNDAADNIFFENDAGAITYNELILFGDTNIVPIRHTDIKNIYVAKKRSLAWNNFFGVTFLVELYFAQSTVSAIFSLQFLSYSVASILTFLASVSLEVNRYKFCIQKKNAFIKVKIKKENISNFKMLANKINQIRLYGFIS